MTKLGWVQQLFPFFFERKGVKQRLALIDVKKKKLQQGLGLDPTWQKYLKLERKDLEDSLRSELGRRETFQRRALAFLGSIAVMSAFTIGAMSLLSREEGVIPDWAVGSGVVMTLIYLAGAAWSALEIAAPRELFDLTLLNRMSGEEPIVNDNLKGIILHLIQFNQAYNLNFAIYSIRSHRGLRNGLLALVLTLILLAINALLV